MSAMPIGMPGWPELEACTASMASARIALAHWLRRATGGGALIVTEGSGE